MEALSDDPQWQLTRKNGRRRLGVDLIRRNEVQGRQDTSNHNANPAQSERQPASNQVELADCAGAKGKILAEDRDDGVRGDEVVGSGRETGRVDDAADVDGWGVATPFFGAEHRRRRG